MDRQQLKRRALHMERQAGGNLVTADRKSADIQRRAGLGRYDRHSRRVAGNRLWAAGAVFCRRRYENLRQLCRGQKAGTRPQAVYPFCTGKGRGDLRAGIDAGGVFYRAGHGVYDYYPIGQLRDEQRDTTTGVDRRHKQRGVLG